MITKVKEYFNGPMEPEPASEPAEQLTDLGTAAKIFQTMGIIILAICAVIIPAVGFSVTIILFGILFIGISIILKAQDQILQELRVASFHQNQIAQEAEQGEE